MSTVATKPGPVDSCTAQATEQLRDLLAFEEKMMHELPIPLCRLRIERVKSFYTERHGLEAARRIHSAMKAKLIARRTK